MQRSPETPQLGETQIQVRKGKILCYCEGRQRGRRPWVFCDRKKKSGQWDVDNVYVQHKGGSKMRRVESWFRDSDLPSDPCQWSRSKNRSGCVYMCYRATQRYCRGVSCRVEPYSRSRESDVMMNLSRERRMRNRSKAYKRRVKRRKLCPRKIICMTPVEQHSVGHYYIVHHSCHRSGYCEEAAIARIEHGILAGG
jgi:hypothetical protein